MLVLLAAAAGARIVSTSLLTCMERHNAATLPRGVVERQGAYWVDFLSRGEPTCLNQPAPNKASLTTIIYRVPELPQTRKRFRRRHDCQPRTFAETLFSLAGRTRRATVTMSPVVITKYFTGIVAGQWKRTTVSFHVQSLRSFFRYASSRGWCAAGIAESIDAPRLYLFS